MSRPLPLVERFPHEQAARPDWTGRAILALVVLVTLYFGGHFLVAWLA